MHGLTGKCPCSNAGPCVRGELAHASGECLSSMWHTTVTTTVMEVALRHKEGNDLFVISNNHTINGHGHCKIPGDASKKQAFCQQVVRAVVQGSHDGALASTQGKTYRSICHVTLGDFNMPIAQAVAAARTLRPEVGAELRIDGSPNRDFFITNGLLENVRAMPLAYDRVHHAVTMVVSPPLPPAPAPKPLLATLPPPPPPLAIPRQEVEKTPEEAALERAQGLLGLLYERQAAFLAEQQRQQEVEEASQAGHVTRAHAIPSLPLLPHMCVALVCQRLLCVFATLCF